MTLARLGGLSIMQAFTKLGGLQLTAETFKEAIWEVIATFVSLIPPDFLKIAFEKRITMMKFLEWWKQYTIKMYQKHKAEGNKKKMKADIASFKIIKTVYAVLGAAKAFVKSFAPSKVESFLTPENLYRKLLENLDKIKKADPEGYRNMLLFIKYIKEDWSWWEAQVKEFRDLFLS